MWWKATYAGLYGGLDRDARLVDPPEGRRLPKMLGEHTRINRHVHGKFLKTNIFIGTESDTLRFLRLPRYGRR